MRHDIKGTIVEESGSGASVVLIHGLGMNRQMWQWQVPALEERYRVVRYDLLGHGESKPPSDPVSLKALSDQLAEVMDALGIECAALVGFSLGGMIVRRFTMDHPGRALALGILHSAHDRTQAERDAILVRVEQAARDGPAATVGAALERWFTTYFADKHPDVLDLVRKWVMANDQAIYPGIYRVLAEGDAEIAGCLSAIDCPTLVMTGEEDYGNSPDMTKRMAAGIAGAEAVILPKLRHMALAEDPDTVNRILTGFLARALG